MKTTSVLSLAVACLCIAISSGALTTKYCVFKGKVCPTDNIIESNAWAGTPRACTGKCNRDARCLGVHHSSDRLCTLKGARCSPVELQDGVGTEYYRLQDDEPCPAGSERFQPEDPNYSNTFCMMWGKVCNGKKAYYQKPSSISPYQDCLAKCNKIPTCSMVNFDATTGKCDPLLDSCDDEELLDAPNTQNFLRLDAGQVECPNNRVPPSSTPPPPPPPTTEEPTEEPTAEPTLPPVATLPPVVTDTCMKPYIQKVVINNKNRMERIAKCEAGCKMTVCHCQPFHLCDGAQFTTGGGCRIRRRTTGKFAKISQRKPIKAYIKCEGAKEVRYLRLERHGEPITCPLGYRKRDCTFYARGRGGNKKGIKGCAPGRGCRRRSGCLSTASCVKY